MEDGVDKREDQFGVNLEPDAEEIEDVVLYDEIECHWRMVFEDKNGEVHGKNTLLHKRRWDLPHLRESCLQSNSVSVQD